MRKICRWVTLVAAALAASTAIAAPPASSAPPDLAASAATPATAPVAKQPAPATPDLAAWTRTCSVPGVAHPEHAVLDGSAASAATRRMAFARLQQCATDGSVAAQEFVGALYWMGGSLPSALVRRNPQVAVKYFSNAAAHGGIRDMAKLAEIELALNQPRAAWTWAQLFGHYVLHPRPAGAGQSEVEKYAADLIKRTDPGVSATVGRAAAGDAAAFLAYYGPGIAAYQRHLEQRRSQPGEKARVVQSGKTRAQVDGDLPMTALADYLVAIKPDGSVQQAWTIDAFPTPDNARRLRAAVLRTRFTAADHPGIRYQVAHVMSDDQRYVMHRNGEPQPAE